MTGSLPRRCSLTVFLYIAIWGWLSIASQPAQGGGITYLPNTTSKDVMGPHPNLSLLTWQLPQGLLVADRLASGNKNRYGAAFEPAYSASEWFLIRITARSQDQGHLRNHGLSHDPSHRDVATNLSGFGTIHLFDDGVFLIEVPQNRLSELAQVSGEKVRIPLTPPPAGWDRVFRPTPTPFPQKEDEQLSKVAFIQEVDADSFYQTLQEITGATTFWHDGSEHTVSTRYYNTADKELVGEYLATILTNYGYSVEFDEFVYNGWICRNIVATKLGTTTPDEYVVVGGHYDSTSPIGYSLAPGAEDNGSGTSLVMEVARIAANREFQKSVQFVLFDSEEQGLNGSYHFVDEAITDGRNIVAAITADMVTWYASHYAVIIEGETPWEWLMTIMESNVDTFTNLGYRKDYFSWGSDHVPFQQAGIAAFLAIDWDWNSYPHYHQTTDTWDNVAATAEIGVEITKACAGTLADLAILLPPISNVGDHPPGPAVALEAHPNPFNPQVSITYRLQESGLGQLAVFDLSGRRLVILASGLLADGDHTVTWDGRDAHGRMLSSGIYICFLETENANTSLKLNLTR